MRHLGRSIPEAQTRQWWLDSIKWAIALNLVSLHSEMAEVWRRTVIRHPNSKPAMFMPCTKISWGCKIGVFRHTHKVASSPKPPSRPPELIATRETLWTAVQTSERYQNLMGREEQSRHLAGRLLMYEGMDLASYLLSIL